MKTILKKTLKYLFFTLALLLVALISVPYLFKSQIKNLVIEKIDAQVNAKVTFGDLSLSSLKHFPRFSVTLNNVCVTGVDEFTNDTLLAAKEIDVTFNLYKFIKGNHEIKGIHLEEPMIYALILKNGKANYDITKTSAPGASAAKESSFEIAIDKWSINKGRIVYNDKLQKTYIEVGGLNHSGSGDFKQEISDLDLTTQVSDLTVRYNGVRYFRRKNFSADLQMEMNLKEKKFTFKDHNFQLGNFKFGFEGYFKLLEKGYETDIKFVVKETSFKNLLSLLPGIYKKDMAGIETAGEFNCKGFIKGVYDVQDNTIPKFHIDLQVDSAMFKYNHLPRALENINFEFVADNTDGNPEHTLYNLKRFHFEIDKQPTHGSVLIKGNINMEITADIQSKADLAEIERIYPIDNLSLKGLLRSEIKVSGIYNDSLKLFPAFNADIEIENGALKYKGLPKAVQNINLHLLAHNKDGVAEHTIFEIPVFHLDIDKNPMHGSLSIKGLGDMEINADIKLRADLAHLEEIYPIDSLVLKGIVNAEIKLEGRYSDSLKLFPKADVFISLEKGSVKYKNLPLEMDSIHLNAEIINTSGKYADTHINLNHLAFRVDDEPFLMSGTISDLKDFNYSMKIDGLLDLAKLSKLYPIPNTTLKGTLDFDVSTKGNLKQIEAKNYSALKAKGTLEVKEVSYSNTDLAFPIHVDDALFTFNAHKIELTRFKGEFGKSNITLTGDLYNYVPFLLRNDAPIKGDLILHCDTLDLNEWFPSSASTSTKVDTTKTTASSSPQVIVIPSNFSFTFDSDIQMLKFGALDVANLDGEIKIQNGVMTLNETGFNTLDSKVTLSGDYTTNDPKHPTFDMDITIDKLDFKKAYKTFVDPKVSSPASGNFSTKYSLKGEITAEFKPVYSTLSGGGKIIIDSVSIKGMKLMNHIKNTSKKDAFKDPVLSDVTIETEIKNGKLLIFPFTFQVSKFLTEIEGSQGLEDESIDYSIKLSVPPFNKLKIPMSIKGTADKPVIRMGKGFSDADFEQLQ